MSTIAVVYGRSPRRLRLTAAVGLVLPLLAGIAVSDRGGPLDFDPENIQAIVLERDEADAGRLTALRALGANTVITHSGPNALTAEAARRAGLFYIAFLTTRQIDQASRDPYFRPAIAGLESLVGFYYLDDGVAVEGYTSPDSQERAYRTLKAMFPEKLVLFATRLDLLSIDAGYRDSYFRPQYTDLVTSYFYPVGTASFGAVTQASPWAQQLEPLLAALAQKMPAGQGVLPVLQGFEPIGYSVNERFLPEQMEVYRRIWPSLRNAAVFAWEIEVPQPLIELENLPEVQRGVCDLFANFASRPSRCGQARRVDWR
jgi:hypothetical protein